MEEGCQVAELQALQAIYTDDFQDLPEEPYELPKVCLKLTPLQSVAENKSP